jgi:hypothetical protein
MPAHGFHYFVFSSRLPKVPATVNFVGMLRFVGAAAGAVLLGVSACGGDAFGTSGAEGGGGGSGGQSGTTGTGTGGSPEGVDAAMGGSSQGGDRGDAAFVVNMDSNEAAPEGGSRDATMTDVADARPQSWCAGRTVAFCADFDSASMPADGWTTVSVTNGAVLDFDSAVFASSPRSMHSKVPAGTGAGSTAANLRKTVPTTLSHAVLDFDCNVKSIGNTPGGWYLQLAWLARNTSELFGLYAKPGAWTIIASTGQTLVASMDVAAPTSGHFVHVTIETVWSPTNGSMRIALDGVTAYNQGGLANSLGAATTAVELGVGLSDYSGNTGAGEMSIDNVTLLLQ